jgi:hypothetical protein
MALMTRSSSLVERPIIRLLLLALMGLALASRLALGATLPVAGAGAGAASSAADPLDRLQAAMIMCHSGHDPTPAPAPRGGPLLSDLLVFDQADNAHALASDPIAALPPALQWCAAAFLPVHVAGRPALWRAAQPPRGPPIAV